MTSKTLTIKQKASNVDINLCRAANTLLKFEYLHRFFHIVSRLGDGSIWYVAILCLPFLGYDSAMLVSVVMTLTGLLNIYIYKAIKKSLARPRPFMDHNHIVKGTSVLDEFSFPSGHTLHAVAFTIILTGFLPATAILFIPFAILTGLSRVILGVHYPSDVAFGAMIGVKTVFWLK